MSKEPTLSLEERVRKTSDEFRFDSLISGPEALPSTPAETERDPRPVEQPREPNRRAARPQRMAAVAVAALALFGLAYAGFTQFASRPVEAAKPLTVLKRGLPDARLTPGETAKSGGGEIAEATRREVFRSYGLAPEDTRYVPVRLIPTTLNGTSGARNLFPATPWFAQLKDRLDKQMTEMVSSGKLTAERAEAELKEDWIAAVHRYRVRNYGEGDPAKAGEIEKKLGW
jgi:hypothetical protein